MSYYKTYLRDYNGLLFLKAINRLAFNSQSQNYLPHTLNEAKRYFLLVLKASLSQRHNYGNSTKHWNSSIM